MPTFKRQTIHTSYESFRNRHFDGHFTLKYDPETYEFSAYAYQLDGAWRIEARSTDLTGLLQHCHEKGLHTIYGMDEPAINRIYRIMTVGNPAGEYMVELWNKLREGSFDRKLPLGFQPPPTTK